MSAPKVKYLPYVDPRGFRYALVDFGLLTLDNVNPRIPPQANSRDAIVALLQEHGDEIFELAKDMIERKGTSPSELPCVSADGEKFVVKEGNRRYAAQRLLQQPQLLKETAVEDLQARWAKLAATSGAKALPKKWLVVVGEDHEVWIDRRHMGSQDGKGLLPWNSRQKRRRGEQSHGTTDRTNAILAALTKHDSKRFAHADDLKRGFTTFERVVDSGPGRAYIGIDVDENGAIVFTKGERSLRFLENVLADLSGGGHNGKPKLTSRTANKKDEIAAYLRDLDAHVDDEPSAPITIESATIASPPASPPIASKKSTKTQTVLDRMRTPNAARAGKIFGEIKRVVKLEMPNASLVLTRVLMELEIDHFANKEGLSFAGDANPALAATVKEFRAEVNRANVKIPKAVSDALKFVESKPVSLSEKFDAVIVHLSATQRYVLKEANAKRREISHMVDLLNDGVHRLETVPDIQRTIHVLEVLEPVYNRMIPK